MESPICGEKLAGLRQQNGVNWEEKMDHNTVIPGNEE